MSFQTDEIIDQKKSIFSARSVKLIVATFFLLMFGGCSLNQTIITSNTDTISPTTTTSTTTTTITTTQATTSATTTQSINDEILDRINAIQIEYSDPGYVQIDTHTSYSMFLSSTGMSMTYFDSSSRQIIDQENMYYFETYSDNESNEYWYLIEKINEDLIIYENDNQVLSKKIASASMDNYLDFIPFSDEYNDELFADLDFKKSDENTYYIISSYNDFINNYSFDDDIDDITSDDSQDIKVRIEYQFTDSSVRLWISFIIYLDDTHTDKMTVSYSSTLSYPSSYVCFKFDPSEYYIVPDKNVNEYMENYEVGDEIKVFMNQNQYYYIKFDLNPGYYDFYATYITDGTTLIDTEGNVINENPYFKITEAGTYYLKIKASRTDKADLISYQVPESDIGTIENPVVASGTISGSLSDGVYDFHLLDINAEGYIMKITCNLKSHKYASLYTIYNNTWSGYSEGSSIYIIVSPGEDVILKVSAGSYTTDYEFQFEVMDFSESITEIENMPELTICSTIEERNDYSNRLYILFGPNTGSVYAKFVVEEAGYYSLRVEYTRYTVSEEDANYRPSQSLYDYEGNILTESAKNSTYLEPGIYYVEIHWYDGYYCVINTYIEKQ